MKTGVQTTSLEAYRQIRPTLGRRQQQVFEFLSRVKDASNSEIAHALNLPINQVTPRIYELRQKGVVADAGSRKCRRTGRNVKCWTVSQGQLTFF